jgi:transposase
MKTQHQTAKTLKPSLSILSRIGEHCSNDYSAFAIAVSLCLALSTVYYWVKRFKTEGIDGLKYKKRGRPIGSGRKLEPFQEANIQELIKSSLPSDHGLNYSTWTRRSVAEMVYNLYQIKIAVRTMGDYLQRWNMSPQKPVKYAIQRDEEKIRTWCNIIFPQIWAKAKSIGAKLFFGDESGMNTHGNNEKCYSPIGQTPVVKTSGTRFKTNVLSAISPDGLMRYMTYNVSMNARLFITFMANLIKSAHGAKVFFIVDNLKSHHSKIVTEWLRKHSNEIEVFYLPEYAPELNPVEYINNVIKQRFKSARQPVSKEEFSTLIGKILKHLQSDHKMVQSFFQKDEVKYILKSNHGFIG